LLAGLRARSEPELELEILDHGLHTGDGVCLMAFRRADERGFLALAEPPDAPKIKRPDMR
jgi:hypothetical protein